MRLVIHQGPGKGREYECLESEKSILGRSSKNQVPLPDLLCSRHHARIWKENGSWWLEDLGSRNGIYVNGVKQKKIQIKIKDKIQLGHTVLLFDESAKGYLAGKTIAGYKFLEKIGSGGMGDVYRAHQRSLDRIVAIKVLSQRLKNKKNTVDNFIREAQKAGILNHPNIIRVHDVGQTEDGLVYFSMEYVDGCNLKEWVAECKKKDEDLPLAELCQIFAKVAKGLHYAHTQKIIHRDIKPDNIMLTEKGEVKIADLGIAHDMEENSLDEATFLETNKKKKKVIGTPHYMAPEQVLGREADGRLDIYSLGASAYHMFSGHTVFRGKTAQEVIRAHLRVRPTPLADLNEMIPEELEAIVMKMLEKKPSNRFQQASEVVRAFEEMETKLKSAKKSPFFGRFKKP
jgi:serine/threonine protein kinase